MLLKSLELQGFKTFPDKTKLTFENGITAVVGPNGSGKSNISDAMRWVLGEQSVRTLRCNRMEDVIFSGTPARKALGYAEVTLNIDNTDRSLPFDNDTVSVSRRYYRSGESEYLLNKASVRLKDINELFMDTGLGRDGYSVIGQGKIDSIVAAKSEERREIFEEAAGVSRFRYRKEEAERRLDRAEDNLVRLRDIFAELDARLGPLKEQAQKAEKFIAYSEEKKGLEIGIWLETLYHSEKALREQEHKTAIAESQYVRAQEDCAQITGQIEENFAAINAGVQQMETLRMEASALEEEAVRTDGEQAVAKSDMAHAMQDRQRMEQEIAQTRLSKEEIAAQVEQKQAAITAREQIVQKTDVAMLALNEQTTVRRRRQDTLAAQSDAQNTAIQALQASLHEEQVRYSSAAASLQEIDARAGQVDGAIEESNRKIELLTQQEKLCREKADTLTKQAEALQNSIRGYEMRVEMRQKRVEKVKAQVDAATLDAGELQRRIKLLEDLERNMEGFSQSVKVVMRESTRGNLGGVHGTVSRLITVPKEYAVAIETALGAAMQNIVVGTDRDAKNAIALLKRQDAGRATFLPLTIMKGNRLNERGLENCAGFVGIASDLCQCEAKYQAVMDSLLGRIAVAEDLHTAGDMAARFGYRFRIVTLDGQVINTGGSFTGGSQAKNSGLLSRAADIVRLKERLTQMQQELQALTASYKTAGQELSGAQAELETAKNELVQSREEYVRCAAQNSQITFQLAAQQQNLRDLTEEKEQSGKRVESLRQRQAESVLRQRELTEQIASQQRQMEERNDARAKLKEEEDALLAQIEVLKLSAWEAEKEIDAAKEAMGELQLRITSREEKDIALQEEMQRLDEQLGEYREKLQTLCAQSENLRLQAEEKRQQAVKAAQKRTELEAQATALRIKERDSNTARENIGQELARLQERRETLQKEFDGSISRLWEEYELTPRTAEEIGIVIEDLPKAQRRLNELKNKIKVLGAVNVGAVVEYKEVSERHAFLQEQIGDIEKSKAELEKLIRTLTSQMQELFLTRFAEIRQHFTVIFKELFGGGSAQLSLTDENDVLHSGIEIKVHPPGKIVTHIEALSGGEMSLVAISIYFAIMKVNPPPFCMVDEIEAALDDVNVTRFASYLRRMTDKTQIIAVTHRRGTMEQADMLYGVTMQEQGVSKLLALHMEEAAERLGLPATN